MIESDLTSSLNGVGITLKGSRENNCVDRQGNVYDFVSRYFSPWHGIPEDPVTGMYAFYLTYSFKDELQYIPDLICMLYITFNPVQCGLCFCVWYSLFAVRTFGYCFRDSMINKLQNKL